MEIQKRHIDSTIIADIKGILDTGTSEMAQDVINGYLEEGHKKLVINLEQTEYMSSSGLRVLLSTAKKLWAMEGKFRICSPNKLVKDILDTSGFSVIMEVMGSEEEALTGM
jgi:anti-sigma B factor antagonist